MKFLSISVSIFALSALGISAFSIANSGSMVASVSIDAEHVTVNDPGDIQDYIDSLNQ